MATKEERLAKKQEKILARNKKSQKLANRVAEQDNNVKFPKVSFLNDLQKKPTQEFTLSDIKVPVQSVSCSRFSTQMSWCARYSDIEGEWQWGELRSWSENEWSTDIRPYMNSLESMLWKEIQNMGSDSGHRMHHDHDICDLSDDIISRWFELGLDQFETLFRFRLGNTKRAWGIELQGHFYLIWYERYHNIYPVS